MLSDYASPIPIKTLKRYHSEIAISLDDIDSVDVIIISHDHYDHLDYKTIKKLNNKVKKYIVPIGIRRLPKSRSDVPNDPKSKKKLFSAMPNSICCP